MTPRLTVVPDTAPVRRDGRYVRVSAVMGRDDERFLSPDLQVEAIDRARAAAGDSVVMDTWTDLDVSTRQAHEQRPGLMAAVTAAEAGAIDRLWVYNVDRWDRDTAGLLLLDRVESAGVELWSTTGRVDGSSPDGRFGATILLAVARYQRDRIGASWRSTHEHRVAAGLPHSGKPKWGYRYDPDQRLHVPDPNTAPVVAEVYRRYLAGESVYALTRWLNDTGVPTLAGGTWSARSLRRVLDSGFPAGFVPFRGRLHPGAHEPLVDAGTWAAYQAARRRRAVVRGSERSQYLLSGMVRCSCGSAMVAGQYGHARQPKYRCKAAAEKGAHAGGYVTASFVETAVVDWLRGLAGDVQAAADAARLQGARRDRRARDTARAEREERALGQQLVRLTRQLAAGVVPEDAYVQARAGIEADLARARARLLRLRDESALAVQAAPLAADLLADWELLPVEQRREALRRLVSRVVVTPGRPRGTVEIVPVWAG